MSGATPRPANDIVSGQAREGSGAHQPPGPATSGTTWTERAVPPAGPADEASPKSPFIAHPTVTFAMQHNEAFRSAGEACPSDSPTPQAWTPWEPQLSPSGRASPNNRTRTRSRPPQVRRRSLPTLQSQLHRHLRLDLRHPQLNRTICWHRTSSCARTYPSTGNRLHHS